MDEFTYEIGVENAGERIDKFLSGELSELSRSYIQKLLKEGTMKISEVAETSGYSDVYYFSKKFKKACGCSPKEYAAKYS